MRNDVKGVNGDRSVVFVLSKALECIQKADLKKPCGETVRNVIKGIKGATTDYRSRFSKTPKKICCVRVPRVAFSQDLLEQLDAGKRFRHFRHTQAKRDEIETGKIEKSTYIAKT